MLPDVIKSLFEEWMHLFIKGGIFEIGDNHMVEESIC
jgi:hypothetical protein